MILEGVLREAKMADLKDNQIKAEIDSIMDRVAQIMEKVGSLGLGQENADSKVDEKDEETDKACCSNG